MARARRLLVPEADSRDVDAAMRAPLARLVGANGVMSRRSGYSIGIGFCPDWRDSARAVVNDAASFTVREGMVLHVIPWVQTSAGSVGFSDVVHVTSRGAVSLFD